MIYIQYFPEPLLICDVRGRAHFPWHDMLKFSMIKNKTDYIFNNDTPFFRKFAIENVFMRTTSYVKTRLTALAIGKSAGKPAHSRRLIRAFPDRIK